MKNKWADMYEKSEWKDERHCEKLTLVARTKKAQRDLADYHPKIIKSMEKWFQEDVSIV